MIPLNIGLDLELDCLNRRHYTYVQYFHSLVKKGSVSQVEPRKIILEIQVKCKYVH